MSIFKHRFNVKKQEKKEKTEIPVERGEPTGIDGKQAGESVLAWEKGTIFRKQSK
ncbi:hypothetical protein ES702_04243 [subsurface metagenome]